jgi:tryptophan-rich sensory protein
VVWSVLYLCIGFAGWLVWKQEGSMLPLFFWGAQWVFNAAWSWLFFGRRRMDQGFYDICLLWISAAGFILSAWPISRAASLLFLPYLAWISTAALLNLTVWRLNPGESARVAKSVP